VSPCRIGNKMSKNVLELVKGVKKKMQGIPCIVELVAPKRMPTAATEKPNNSQNRSKQVKTGQTQTGDVL
jgi:hypothetical protein